MEELEEQSERLTKRLEECDPELKVDLRTQLSIIDEQRDQQAKIFEDLEFKELEVLHDSDDNKWLNNFSQSINKMTYLIDSVVYSIVCRRVCVWRHCRIHSECYVSFLDTIEIRRRKRNTERQYYWGSTKADHVDEKSRKSKIVLRWATGRELWFMKFIGFFPIDFIDEKYKKNSRQIGKW